LTVRVPTRRPRRLLAFVVAVSALAGILPVAAPATVSAGQAPTAREGDALPASPTVDIIEGYIRTWLNDDRVARGLRPLRLDVRLRGVARDRASRLAVLNVLDHAAAGDLTDQLAAADVQQFGWGEDIGWTGYAWGQDAARSLYGMWKNSPEHWTLMMSPDFNYVGIGLGYRQAGNATFGSIVFTDSADKTPPAAEMTAATRTGTTVHFSWTGTDVVLQTHTSGIASYDVQYRVGAGSWRTIRTKTKSTALSLSSRPHGYTYYLSVRARDKAGNLSPWSPALHVYVP